MGTVIRGLSLLQFLRIILELYARKPLKESVIKIRTALE